MLMSCVIYWLIGDFISLDSAMMPNAYPMVRNAFVLASICIGAVGIYFGWGRTHPKEEEYPGAYLQRATSSMIVCMAMFEVVGILGLTLRFMGNTLTHRPFIAVAFVLILVAGSRIGRMFSNFESLKDMQDARRF